MWIPHCHFQFSEHCVRGSVRGEGSEGPLDWHWLQASSSPMEQPARRTLTRRAAATQQPVGLVSTPAQTRRPQPTSWDWGGAGRGAGKEKGGHGGRRGCNVRKRKGLCGRAEGDRSAVMSQQTPATQQRVSVTVHRPLWSSGPAGQVCPIPEDNPRLKDMSLVDKGTT